MLAAPFVADPARDADRQAHLEIVVQLVRLAGEAMRNRARGDDVPVLSQDRDKVRMRVALMQKHRFAHACGNLQLARESGALHVARGEVAEVIEPAFADGDDFGRMGERFQFLSQLIRELSGVMGMYASGRKQFAQVLARQRGGFARAVSAGSGYDQLGDAGRGRAGHYSDAIAVITIVSEVDPDVDQGLCDGR